MTVRYFTLWQIVSNPDILEWLKEHSDQFEVWHDPFAHPRPPLHRTLELFIRTITDEAAVLLRLSIELGPNDFLREWTDEHYEAWGDIEQRLVSRGFVQL